MLHGIRLAALTAFAAFGWVAVSLAHFQILVPGSPFVTSESRQVTLDIVFSHPMEGGPVMGMGEPKQFGVIAKGEKVDLREALKAKKLENKTAYDAAHEVKLPGDLVYFIEPAPYWEPAEQKMIIHYTKVVVNAFGEEESWDAMVGFPVEIQPLVRPYGLWAGNAFQGVVKEKGIPVPFAEIEVEYLNREGKIKPPADAFVTQVIKADANGVFTYVMPKSGWWGFAALIDGDEKMKSPEGKKVDVELGALMWVHCTDMK